MTTEAVTTEAVTTGTDQSEAAVERPLKVALVGSRGIPARYGGYETFLEELGSRLAARGHEVTVYCRSRYTRAGETLHKGVHLVRLPTIPTKHLDTPVHTLLSGLHALMRSLGRRGYDVALVVNGANAMFVPLLRLARVPTALHVDGIEKRRRKWGVFGRAVYALSERLACVVPNVLVTDAEVIRQHYLARYGADSAMITYGVEPEPPSERGVLERLGLASRRFFLYVSRFEPENHPLAVVRGYRRVGGDLPLVMVGDAPYADGYIEEVRAAADPRVIFPGAIYGDGYRELLENAFAYIHGTEVGGTHPALVEAMGYGNCVVVNDTPENREVAGDCGRFFRVDTPSTLGTALDAVRADPDAARTLGQAAGRRAAEIFNWDRVTEDYARLLARLAGRRR